MSRPTIVKSVGVITQDDIDWAKWFLQEHPGPSYNPEDNFLMEEWLKAKMILKAAGEIHA